MTKLQALALPKEDDCTDTMADPHRKQGRSAGGSPNGDLSRDTLSGHTSTDVRQDVRVSGILACVFWLLLTVLQINQFASKNQFTDDLDSFVVVSGPHDNGGPHISSLLAPATRVVPGPSSCDGVLHDWEVSQQQAQPGSGKRRKTYVAWVPKGRLGNQMFQLSTAIGIARRRGAIVCNRRVQTPVHLDEYFEASVARIPRCPLEQRFVRVGECGFAIFSRHAIEQFPFSSIELSGGNDCGGNTPTHGKDCCYWQSWRYFGTQGVQKLLRCLYRWKPTVSAEVDRWLGERGLAGIHEQQERHLRHAWSISEGTFWENSAASQVAAKKGDTVANTQVYFSLDPIEPATMDSSTCHGHHESLIPSAPQSVFVGIHLRNTDHTSANYLLFPPDTWYDTHISALVDERTWGHAVNVTFILMGDDARWTRQWMLTHTKRPGSMLRRPGIGSVHFAGGTPQLSLALMARCSLIITSRGTFSWWGAWLAGRGLAYNQEFNEESSIVKGCVNVTDYWQPDVFKTEVRHLGLRLGCAG